MNKHSLLSFGGIEQDRSNHSILLKESTKLLFALRAVDYCLLHDVVHSHEYYVLRLLSLGSKSIYRVLMDARGNAYSSLLGGTIELEDVKTYLIEQTQDLNIDFVHFWTEITSEF